MHVISWNLRGANGRKKQQVVRLLRSRFRMDMILIQESKISKFDGRVAEAMWGNEKASFGFVDAEGNKGGLIILWDPEFMKVIKEVKGKGFILLHGSVVYSQQEILINFVNVYAPSGEKEKLQLWEELVELKGVFEGEWVIGGDFNSVLVEEERRGSCFNKKDAIMFHEAIQALGVLDLPLRGRKYTWGNKNGASRLDRFLISPGVVSLWPKLEQRGLDKGPSDHAAIALAEEDKFWGRKPCRILDVWLDQPGIKDMISGAWKSSEDKGWKGYSIQKKLSRVRRVLAQWNKNKFGDVRSKLRRAGVEWERLSLLQDSRGLSEEESLRKEALRKRIWHLEVLDERIWRQKSRIRWLKEGDLNTKYFHRAAIWRTKTNEIASIKVNDVWLEDPLLIKSAAQDHFAALFKKEDHCCWSLKDMLFDSLNDNQRRFLERQISVEEIIATLKDCDGSKAPGPDGFNMKFFKKFWGQISDEVVGFMEEFWKNGRLPEGINRTFLVLIPKKPHPQCFDDFRPISLVNSIYKLLAKCLTRRLSEVLPLLISQNQSAFIANRSILDVIMVTNELIHTLKMEKRAALIIKLDF
ncbi:unnamed protein product [Rhodiola kirilowii]